MIGKDEKNKCVFILSPHIDDGELGCGGTIAKLQSEGNKIHFIVFSLAKKSILDKFPKDITEKELYRSMKTFGISEEYVHLYDFEVRTFQAFAKKF